MLACVGAIRLLKMSDPKAPEDVEPTFGVLWASKDGMKTVLESVPLEELRTCRGLEQQPRTACADQAPKHRRKCRTEIGFAGAVLGFQVSLDEAAFRLLLNVEGSAIWETWSPTSSPSASQNLQKIFVEPLDRQVSTCL